jgi:hypothetical protein
VAVPYYHAGCYDCAGAVAAGAVVGVAAGAAIASTAARPAYPAYPAYAVGVNYATIPAGAVVVQRYGVQYYQVGTTWFRPYYGANGVYYQVVAAP